MLLYALVPYCLRRRVTLFRTQRTERLSRPCAKLMNLQQGPLWPPLFPLWQIGHPSYGALSSARTWLFESAEASNFMVDAGLDVRCLSSRSIVAQSVARQLLWLQTWYVVLASKFSFASSFLASGKLFWGSRSSGGPGGHIIRNGYACWQ